jgi:outer membrane lipoprotein-sorting protein
MRWLALRAVARVRTQEASMQSLGEVLELLHIAWDHVSSAQGAMRAWYDPIRTQRAWESWRDKKPAGSVKQIRPSGSQTSEAPQASVTEGARERYVEQYYRFWMTKPWSWRIEVFTTDGQGQPAEPQQVMVIDGAIWWSWTAGQGVYTNARSARPAQTRHSSVDQALLVMLDPAPLAGALRMRVTGSAEEIGRRGDVVTCTARDPQQNPGLWPGADQYRLLVDREYGILLRAEALLVGDVFAGTAFTELLLDQAVPEERFVFQPPAGVPVHDM